MTMMYVLITTSGMYKHFYFLNKVYKGRVKPMTEVQVDPIDSPLTLFSIWASFEAHPLSSHAGSKLASRYRESAPG